MIQLVFLLARLVNGGALRNAVVVATPDDLGAFGKAKNTLDGFPASALVTAKTLHSF